MPCVVLDTELVVTGKVAVVDPAGIVTLVGTKDGEPFVHKSTLVPPAGAGALRVTVPVAEAPLVTLVGFTETDARDVVATAGVTVMVVV